MGWGRSGKSSLIESLTKSLAPKDPELTNQFEIKSCKKEEEGQLPVYFHFTDYRGQNFTQLVSHFIREQLAPNSLLRYGDINSLIVVVDLFSANDEEDSAGQRFEALDEERIKVHLQEWNTTALDAVFGLLTRDSLNYVCLFINKIDKWAGPINAEAIAKTHYSRLIKDLRDRARGIAQFDVVVGSALRGLGIVGTNGSLTNRLFRYSVPLLKEDRKEQHRDER